MGLRRARVTHGETELWRLKQLLAPGPGLGIPEPLPWLSPQIHRDAWRHPPETHLQTQACTRALEASQLSPGQAGRRASRDPGSPQGQGYAGGPVCPSGWLSADPERASAGARGCGRQGVPSRQGLVCGHVWPHSQSPAPVATLDFRFPGRRVGVGEGGLLPSPVVGVGVTSPTSSGSTGGRARALDLWVSPRG